MKKVLLIALTTLTTLVFQLKVFANVDEIPDGTYIGETNLFIKETIFPKETPEIIRKKIKSPLAIVIANGHITGLLLIKAELDLPLGTVATSDQSISINKTKAFSGFPTGTTTFTYKETNKTIKLNSMSNVKPDIDIGQVLTAVLSGAEGFAKKLKKSNDENIKVEEIYSENISNDCKSTHFVNIGTDGFVTVQLLIGNRNPTFFGRIDQEGAFTTIYSESSSFKENRILSIKPDVEKVIVKGVSIEFDSFTNTTKDVPFEVEFLKAACD